MKMAHDALFIRTNSYIFRLFFTVWMTWLLVGCGPAAEAGLPPNAQPDATQLTVGAPAGNPTDATSLPRYGINLGGPSAWGAEQLLANVVANPGFESVLDRSLVVVADVAGAQQWARTTGWNSRPAGFWRGASGEVLTGRHAGSLFQVLDDAPAAQPERALLHTDPPLPWLSANDVVSLQTEHTPALPARWWGQGRISTEAGTPPDSGGQRVVRLEPAVGTTTVLSSYIDTLERAGRMLPVTGAWALRFTAKANHSAPARLRVRVAREGGDVFIDQTVNLDTAWAVTRLTFNGLEPTTGQGTLALSFSLVQGSVDLDDVYLGESTPGAGGFRQVVVDTLRQLNPGYLREWQGQLGDTVMNRLADDTARRPVRYRPGDAEVLHTYSLAQTFSLCKAVGARPWLIVPTTLGSSEAFEYGESVRKLATLHGMDHVMVEFGNENWNPLFAAAGFVSASAHAEAAQRVLAALRSGYGPVRPGDPALVTSVNARMDDFTAVADLAKQPAVDRVSVAPYFAYRFDATQTLADQWRKVFAQTPGTDLQALSATIKGTQARLNAYELNLHTTEGDAPADLRNALVTGAASGPALAMRLLQGSLAGVREQAVYALAGFDAFAANGEPVRLFGVTRDLAWAGHFRPTGLALAMLNAVAGGQPHAAHCAGPGCAGITAMAFVSDRARWALVNSQATGQPLRVAQACQGQPLQARLLNGQNLWLNNETAPMVVQTVPTSECEGGDLRIDIPPRSLVTLQ